jgi:hypothetical protein
MPFAKGKSGNPAGRPKSAPNKINADLKEMILEAFLREGGVEYLRQRARDEPKSFLALLGKVLPMTIQSDNVNASQGFFIVVPAKLPPGSSVGAAQPPASATQQ